MMKQHPVAAGDCLTSIAAQYGFSVDAIWNLADNASLKDKRKDPNTLVPGDVVVIPDRQEKVVSCATAQTHKFKLSAASALLRLQLFEDEKPLASQDCELKIGKTSYTGQTNDQGVLELTIPCTAKEGSLTVGTDKEFELRFGHLQPVTERHGVVSRLHNLGFEGDFEEAVRAFQKRFGLEITGEADQATKDKLSEIHDTVCAFSESSS
jgi:murein DD-endopeptidase MepM/ murein hydrolase activator NlpD